MRSDNATSVDFEIDPHCRRLSRSQTDFALQDLGGHCRMPRGESECMFITIGPMKKL
jgi:hypothetical protein